MFAYHSVGHKINRKPVCGLPVYDGVSAWQKCFALDTVYSSSLAASS